MSLPKLKKIVVNMGVGKALQDKNRMEQAAEQLRRSPARRPQITKARVAVSGFRLRERQRDRLPGDAPRQADVRVPRPADQRRPAADPRLPRREPEELRRQRQLQLGLTEQLVFPEIDPDKVTFTQGMDITFVTSTSNDDEARELLPAVRHAVPREQVTDVSTFGLKRRRERVTEPNRTPKRETECQRTRKKPSTSGS